MKLGIERLDEFKSLFLNKRVGLITNPTGCDSSFTSTIDILASKTNLTGLFSPEHGVRGNVEAGKKLEDYVDQKTGIKVYSLYGEAKKPTKEMVDSFDVLTIDIQDVGSRFYTYIYTMAYSMMACAEYNKEFVVFDRPNPINGVDYEGNILDIEYRSFVGYYPILQRHGLTIGELAMLFNEEYGIGCKLHVIKMDDYDRSKYFDEITSNWVMPSPNIPTAESSLYYNSTCLFEGTNISEGRGTTAPFKIIGAPFIDPFMLSDKMNSFNFEGVYFRGLYFTPTCSKHKNVMCGGVELYILDRKKFKPVKVGFALLDVVRNMYKDDFKFTPPFKEGAKSFFELLTGCGYIKNNQYTLEEQFKILEKDTLEFSKVREKYLLY